MVDTSTTGNRGSPVCETATTAWPLPQLEEDGGNLGTGEETEVDEEEEVLVE